MARLSFLPTEVRFYDWFEKATMNLREAAAALEDLIEDYQDVPQKVDRIIEIEHNGDFIVHEVMNLLPRTLITPIDNTEIQQLIIAIDDALDSIEDTARRLVIFDVKEVKEPARVAEPGFQRLGFVTVARQFFFDPIIFVIRVIGKLGKKVKTETAMRNTASPT